MESIKTYDDLLTELKVLQQEMEETRFRLEEATDTIEAIRTGEVDALIVNDGDGHQLYTLKSADQTYRIFIEQMTEGAVTVNPDGLILYSNSQFAALIGLPLERITGKSFFRFVTEECKEDCQLLIKKAWSQSTKGELSLLTDQNKKVSVLLSLTTLDLDEGLSLSVIITDLTEQKETQNLLEQKNAELEEAQKIAQHLNANLERTVKERTSELEITIREKTKIEESLRENQQRLQRVLDTMAEGVGIIDLNGHLIYANPMAQTMFSLKESQNKLQVFDAPNWQTLRIDGSVLPKEEHPIVIMLANQQAVYDQEIAIQQPHHNEPVYISINASPLVDQNDQLTGGVVTFTDVTARRKAMQQKDDFISIASHELKTPVTSLKASIQLLDRMKDNPSPVMLTRLIEQSGRSLEKLNNLINDLLNVNRITHGQLELRKKQFVLADMIDNSCHHLLAVGTHQIQLNGDFNVTVYADEQRVDQVVVNFLNNAVKYAPDSRDILITAERMTNSIKIEVKDNGPGILPEKIPHLFDRYYRADHSGAQFSGLGLGLYISAEIIKRHGGQIGVNSELGKGSTFWFTLPH
ncbi:PAS domain-containing sensor histidine kinase [Mucilaginibacter agri]|uniref:histidine kinase n=1 Tax=Mucilaginibacter agri TaxID=2695265 RepID=A0A966DX05_9SPHI|nr:ATP-binding protein [Mucilaginibacter agri]NCD71859.1 PAS domain S-box protein [Mucilaginibacter agri]